MTILSARNINVSYGARKAVENVSFDIKKGDYLCVVGANGSGKTTLVKTLLGIIQPDSGYVNRKDCAIGYLSQQNAVQRDFPASVREVVLSGRIKQSIRHPFYSRSDKQIVMRRLEQLGILSLARLPYKHLSGGQQQRVLLARALCAGSDMLVLDEPLTGLDPAVTDELYGLIRSLNKKEGIAVLMVSHDVRRAIANASHILHMNTKALFYGSVEDYKATDLYRAMTFVEVCCR
ncbi:metal ABC transporter ATP-binding protein [Treponema sp. OMZ 840]|uniref:metal ABC transporter ATP-binding protein n=1 Tax=Treponema sp. OMZ 840 TaxID=244313 RepID=UPI003D9165E5